MAAHRGKGSVGSSRKPVRKLAQCQVEVIVGAVRMLAVAR